MNWKEFKNWVESKGVTDEYEITNIDTCYIDNIEKLDINVDDDTFVIY